MSSFRCQPYSRGVYEDAAKSFSHSGGRRFGEKHGTSCAILIICIIALIVSATFGIPIAKMNDALMAKRLPINLPFHNAYICDLFTNNKSTNDDHIITLILFTT